MVHHRRSRVHGPDLGTAHRSQVRSKDTPKMYHGTTQKIPCTWASPWYSTQIPCSLQECSKNVSRYSTEAPCTCLKMCHGTSQEIPCTCLKMYHGTSQEIPCTCLKMCHGTSKEIPCTWVRPWYITQIPGPLLVPVAPCL